MSFSLEASGRPVLTWTSSFLWDAEAADFSNNLLFLFLFLQGMSYALLGQSSELAYDDGPRITFPLDTAAGHPQKERGWGLYLARHTLQSPANKYFYILSVSLLGLHLAVGEMKMCEQLLNLLVSEFPWQPSEGRVPLQKRVAYFQLTKDKEVLTVILLMEASDKFPQPFRCHMEPGMLVFNQKGKYYQIDLLGIHQAPTDNSTCQRWQISTLSEFWV